MESTISNNNPNQEYSTVSNNLLSPEETIIKSRIKGNFSKILQQQSDTILALVGCVTQMNQVLLVQNQQLCNQSLKKNNNDDTISEIIKHKMLTSFMNENNPGSYLGSTITPKPEEDLGNTFVQQMQQRLRQEEQQQRDQGIGFPFKLPITTTTTTTNNGFPPSSVEQALNNSSSENKSESKSPLDALGITGTEGKEFLRVLIHGITGSPEIFNKIADGIGKKFNEIKESSPETKLQADNLLSKTEELKKAAQEVANKSLSKQDEDQLAQLAKRIEQHDKELKAQEIETFLQSDNEINI